MPLIAVYTIHRVKAHELSKQIGVICSYAKHRSLLPKLGNCLYTKVYACIYMEPLFHTPFVIYRHSCLYVLDCGQSQHIKANYFYASDFHMPWHFSHAEKQLYPADPMTVVYSPRVYSASSSSPLIHKIA